MHSTKHTITESTFLQCHASKVNIYIIIKLRRGYFSKPEGKKNSKITQLVTMVNYNNTRYTVSQSLLQ